MGKQDTKQTELSQEKYDKNLDESVDILMNDGASDDAILEYVNDYKNRFTVKKKEDTLPVSENGSEDDSVISPPPSQNGEEDGPLPSTSIKDDKLNKIKNKLFTSTKKESPFVGDKKRLRIKETDPSTEESLLSPELQPLQDAITKRKEEAFDSLLNKHFEARNNPDDLVEVSATIENEKKGNFGFISKVADAFISTNTPIINLFGAKTEAVKRFQEINKTKKEISQLKGIPEKEVTDKDAEDFFYKKREKQLTEEKGDNRIRELNENISTEEQDALENHFSIKDMKLRGKSTEKLLNVERLKKTRESLIVELKSIQSELQDRKATFDESKEYGEDFFTKNNELNERQIKIAETINTEIPIAVSKEIDAYNNIKEDVMSTSNEIDLYKRNYNDVANVLGKFTASAIDFTTNISEFQDKYDPQQALINKINKLTGFDSEKENIKSRQRLRDLTKDIKGSLRRPIKLDDINHNNIVDWAMDLTSEQAVNVIVLGATGGAGTALIGASSAGSKVYQMDQDEKLSKGAISYSPTQKFFAPLVFGTAEALSEQISFGQINKMKRIFKSQSPDVLRRSVRTYINDNYKDYLKDIVEEGGSEAVSQLSQNITDKYFLGKKISLTDGLTESFVSGAFMSGVIFKMPVLLGDLRKGLTSKDTNQQLGEISDKIISLSRELENQDISQDIREQIIAKQNNLLASQEELLKNTSDNLDKISLEDKKALLEIENSRYNLRKEYDEVNRESSISDETRRDLLKDLSKKASDLEIKKENILNPTPLIKEGNSKIDSPFVKKASKDSDTVEDLSDIGENLTAITKGDTKVIIKEDEKGITLESIETKEDSKGNGNARKAIKEIAETADSQGKEIALKVVPKDENTTVKQLEDFYESEGFEKTENYETSKEMVRKPSSEVVEDLTSVSDTFFDPSESEGESIGRLSESITEENKKEQITKVAKEHTDSYIEYLKEQKAPKEVLESEFVKTFEKRLIGALKNPSKFDFNQKRERGNGSRIDANNNEISELEYLKNQGDISSDSVKKETTPKNKKTTPEKIKFHKIGNSTYSIELIDGELKVTPQFGNKKAKISDNIKRKARAIYLKETDFSKGNYTETNPSANEAQQRSEIADNSENAQEIATALISAKKANKDIANQLDTTVDDAIAQALKGRYIQKDNHKDITDIPLSFKRKNKYKKSISLDDARELAESNLGQQVTKQQVIDFIESNSSVSSFEANKKESLLEDVSGLEVAFKNATGLRPTDSNLEGVLSAQSKPNQEQNPIDPNDNVGEVPFQVESDQERIKGQLLRDLIKRLKSVNIQSDVQVLNESSFIKKLKEIGRDFKKIPNGFVHNGIVYLNESEIKYDTPIHEFGHLWLDFISEKNPELYERGISLMKEEGSPYLDRIRNDENYKGLSEEQLLNEALAQAIGNKGVDIHKESLKDKFKLWFKQVFSSIRKGFGLKSFTDSQLNNLTLDKFVASASAEILSGKDIRTGEKSSEIKNTNIEKVIEIQDAVANARDKVIEQMSNKKAIGKDVRKALLNYINENLKRESVSNGGASKAQLERLISIVSNTETEPNYEKSLLRIDKIVDEINKKEFSKHYELIKSRALAKKELNNQKALLARKKAVLKSYKNRAINKKWYSNATQKDILQINKAIEIGTNTSLSNAVKLIDKVTERLENRYNEVQAKIEDKSRVAKDKANNKKINIKARKKALLDYLNLNLDNRNVRKLSKSKILQLIKSVSATDNITDKQLRRKIKQAEKIIYTATNEVILERIDKFLNDKIIQKVSGLKKAVKNTDDVSKIFEKIKSLTRISEGSAKEKDAQRNLVLDDIKNQREIIYDKINSGEVLTKEDVDNLYIFGVSISLIEAQTTTDYLKANELLASVEDAISNLYKSEKIKFKEEIATKKKLEQEKTEKINSAVDKTKGKRIITTDSELSKYEKKQRYIWRKLDSLHRFFFRSEGYVVGSLDALAGLIDRSSGTTARDGAFLNLVDEFKENEQNESIMKIDFLNKDSENKTRIYGKKIIKHDEILNERFDIELDDPQKEGTTVRDFSKSQLINVWQIYQNEKLRKGLAVSGFTDAVVSKIELEILTESDIEYAESLFQVYEELYQAENEVYKRKYLTDLDKADFYAGKIFRKGERVETLDQAKTRKNLTTTSGSQKSRTENNLGIEPQNLSYLLNKRIIEASHFVNNSESFDFFSKLLNNNDFKKNIYNATPTRGKEIFEILEFAKELMANGTPRADGKMVGYEKALEVIARNYVKSKLALKPIGMIKQMSSIVNGSLYMPSGKSVTENLNYIRPDKVLEGLKRIRKDSKFLKLRYQSGQIDLIISGLSSTMESDYVYSKNASVEAKRKQIARGYSTALNFSLKTIKAGDFVGVTGVVPVYLSWYDTYVKQGLSEDVAHQKALTKFERVADVTQQTQSVYGKSRLQLSQFGRYLAMFKSTQIQNMSNVNNSFNQVVRQLKGEDYKGSATKNALNVVNLQLAQPLLYYYTSFVLLGVIRDAFGYSDEEEKRKSKKKVEEMKKGLITTGILGNFGSVPVFSEISIKVVDLMVADKERSFGGKFTTPVFSFVTTVMDDLAMYQEANNPAIKQKYFDRLKKNVGSMAIGFPEYLSQAIVESDIYTDKETDNNILFNKILGWSNWVIENNTDINVEERNIILKLNKRYNENASFKQWRKVNNEQLKKLKQK